MKRWQAVTDAQTGKAEARTQQTLGCILDFGPLSTLFIPKPWGLFIMKTIIKNVKIQLHLNSSHENIGL